ncbi:TAFII28-domain-containing protein [Gonapodya prolifera JEL478]|uniref:TAFII28-domain-containing protein n=1 Tax=Gonapodya prolifera (strain JEL478) TaxID=1344416 RepID=A0A139AYU4_GONPJ|nr:TAFII28-domain-containing protein [Gonapodya prolifera JEL478]|eukprot:KXS21635.1 TAFII28-domain-containing protein [Gonapodya prolifera JEL478]
MNPFPIPPIPQAVANTPSSSPPQENTFAGLFSPAPSAAKKKRQAPDTPGSTDSPQKKPRAQKPRKQVVAQGGQQGAQQRKAPSAAGDPALGGQARGPVLFPQPGQMGAMLDASAMLAQAQLGVPPNAQQGGAAPGPAQDAENVQEEDDDEVLDPTFMDVQKLLYRTSDQQVRERTALYKNMTEDEWKRMETYRRTKIPDGIIKKIVSNSTGQTATKNVIIAISSAAKVFVGDIVDRAKEVQSDWADTGALRPDHLREAYRRYRKDQEGIMVGNPPRDLFG